MPGLIRGVARTAAIAGTATAVSNGVSRRQAQRWANQSAPAPAPVQAQYPPPVAAAPVAPPAAPSTAADDVMSRLERLSQLQAAGLIASAESGQMVEPADGVETPEIVARLVAAGVKVHEVAPEEQTLESFYLRIMREEEGMS